MKKILFTIIFLAIGILGLVKSADAIVWITPVAVTPASDAWNDVDITAYVSGDATGAILHFYSPGNPAANGIRNNGSTDDRKSNELDFGHIWFAVGIDASDIFEAYVDGGETLYLVGYFESEATFFVNATSKGTASSWTDVDISSDTGGDTAIGAFFESSTYAADFAYRKNGSTDDRTTFHARALSGVVIGVDENEILEIDTNTTAWLLGYMTAEATFNTNATDLSLGSTGSWIDLTALPAGGTGGFIEITDTAGFNDGGLRVNGSSEDIHPDPGGREHTFGMVEADGDRIIEGYITNSSVDFWLIGYSTAAAPPPVVEDRKLFIFIPFN